MQYQKKTVFITDDDLILNTETSIYELTLNPVNIGTIIVITEVDCTIYIPYNLHGYWYDIFNMGASTVTVQYSELSAGGES